MKYLKSLLFLLLMGTGVFAQSAGTSEAIPNFKNEGEREEYSVKQLFKKEYKSQDHGKFAGQVKTTDNVAFQFDKLTMVVNYTANDLKVIFNEGILYPMLFGGEDSLKITDLHELKYVSNGATQKRFSLWLFRKMMANPQVYYFELTNEKATDGMDMREFIRGSRLTYFRPGGIIL